MRRSGCHLQQGRLAGHSRVSNRDPPYFRGPGDPNGPWFHVGFRVVLAGN
jgi:formylglycine-generating enzyme required for sulfatase activity